MADPLNPPVDTVEEIENPISVTLTAGDPVAAGSVAAVDAVATTSVTAPAAATFTNVDGNTSLTIDGLNTGTRTLRDSLQSRLNSIADAINTGGFADASDVTAKFNALVTNLNAALGALATSANTRFGVQSGNIADVYAALQLVDEKVRAFDNVFGLEAGDLATKLDSIQQFFDALTEADVDLVTALDAAIDELNSRPVTHMVEVSVGTADGTYTFLNVDHGIPEFTDPTGAEYVAMAQVVGNANAQVEIVSKGAGSFVLQVRTKNLTIVDQPMDCVTTPVKVAVSVNHLPVNVLSFAVDRLTAGNVVGDVPGTTTDTVGQ